MQGNPVVQMTRYEIMGFIDILAVGLPMLTSALRVPVIQQRRAPTWVAIHQPRRVAGAGRFRVGGENVAEFGTELRDGDLKCNPNPATTAIWSPFWS